jgi:hypothetical protein
LSNVTEFPVFVADFLYNFKDFSATSLNDPENISALLNFRGLYKKQWQHVLGNLAAKANMVPHQLNQFLTDCTKAKKLADKKEKKKKELLAQLPANSHMNYKWEEDADGELAKVPKLTHEMWNDLKALFKGADHIQWPVNIRKELIFWDYKNNKSIVLKKDNQTLEFFTALYAKNQRIYWLETRAEGFMPRAEFVNGLTQILKSYDGFSEFPHYPPIPGYFYKLQITENPEKTGKLDELVNMFTPATPSDKDKIRALFCSLFWGGAPSERPMIVIVAKAIHGQSSGKTTLVETASELVSGEKEGYIKFNAEAGLDGETLKKRVLGSEGQRIVFFDNVRSNILGSGYLEDFITSKVISGHRMFHGLDSMKNYFTVCATFNDSMLTRDIVTRSMVIQILPFNIEENKKAEWKDRLDNLINNHREDIITDIKITLESPPVELTKYNRFPRWCRDVLSKCTDDPEIIIKNNAIAEEYNAENEESEKLHEDILAEIARYKIDTLLENPIQHLDWDEFPKMYVRVSESLFLQWVSKSLGFKSSRLAKKKLSQLNLPWLAKNNSLPEISKANGGKFYIYGNPKRPRPDLSCMFRITNSDPFLGRFKNTRYLRDYNSGTESRD